MNGTRPHMAATSGVVTEFEFRLQEVGPIVQFGMLLFGPEQAAEMFRLGRALLAELPRQFRS
jgi:hypothetical protein